MENVKIRSIGNSAGIVLSKEILARLGCVKGDKLYIIPTKNGVELTAYDPAFEEKMKRAEKLMDKNKNLYKRLAE